MKSRVKTVPFFACAILALFCAIPAGASDLPSEKEFVLMDDSGTGMIAENPAQAAFWEYPILPAGQTKISNFFIYRIITRRYC